ncbi:MAG TPA: HEAT repeat domain-containing protein [Planctomycetota bacterium]
MRLDFWLCVLGLSLAPAQSSQEVVDPATERARAHYAAVLEELAAADVSHLSPAQLGARLALIAELSAYRERGDFTRNTDFPGARVPYFVDAEDRLCAVATLLSVSGEDALVRGVAVANNHVWVSELAGDEAFARWLAQNGLTFEEAVRIQGPANPPPEPPPPMPPPSTNAPTVPLGSPENPGRGPATGAPGSSTGGFGPTSGVPVLGPGLPGAPGTPGAPFTPLAGVERESDDWLAWWEVNKLRWLAPALRASVASDDDLTRPENEADRERRALVPRIQRELAHAQAEVRAAAAFAYARAARAAAVPELERLLADASLTVRESAILALGASDSERGVHALLSLLRTREAALPTPRARALAIVGLGLARMHGRGQGTDVMLAQLLGTLERKGDDDVLHAVLLHQTLAPSAALDARVRCATGRYREDCEHGTARPATRGRALEALRFDAGGVAVLPRLLDAAHGRVVDERRSAAGALAAFPAALDPLLTAYELEEEPLTRAHLLLAIGEAGGERARNLLEERLERGRKAERPWAALSLGLLAGAEWDGEARAALRGALAKAGKGERDAFLLALGLARDAEAHDALVRALVDGKSDRARMFAAVALGLIGSEEGLDALRAAVGSVSCSFARSGMALALALYGDPEDVDLLVRLLDAERRPESLRDLALALGLRRAPGTVPGLVALLDSDPAVATRAAALDALGLALSDDARMALPVLAEGSNPATWPEWVRALARMPL